MMISIKRLHDLQELDWEVSAREKSLAEVRARLADDSAIVEAKKRIEQLEPRLAQPVAARRELGLTVQQLEEKLNTIEKRLYGGEITNPRELSAYEAERTILQRHRSAEEERLLELMVEIEDIQSDRDEAQQHLGRLEAEREVERAELLEAEKRLVGELDRLGQARSEMTPQVPGSALSVYESLRKSRNGYAVAKVERGMCQGCRIGLPTRELQQVRSSQDIVQCNSCRRILYVV